MIKSYKKIIMSIMLAASVLAVPKMSFAGEGVSVSPAKAVITEQQAINRYNYNGHSYALLDKNFDSIEDMEMYAESLGGHLVYINDEAENNFVAELTAKYGSKPSYAIGVHRESANDTWKYFNGKEVTFTNWGFSEPNNLDTEFYVHMYTGNGKWNNTLNVPASEIAPTYRIENMGMIIEWD